MNYNTNEVAGIMGVNVSTIKRWADSGKIECYKTKGGHRTFHISHLRNFVKSDKKALSNINLNALVQGDSQLVDAIRDIDTAEIVRHAYRSVIGKDDSPFNSITNSLLIKGLSYSFIFDEIVLPVLVRIGERWKEGRLTITEEHLAAVRIKNLLVNLNNTTASIDSKLNAYCFTLINDKHDLPVYMAESILRTKDNIFVYNLGANLPVDDFIVASKKNPPHIIFVSIVYVENIDAVREEVHLLLDHFSDKDVSIFLSGNGLSQLEIKRDNFTPINSYSMFEDLIESRINKE